jgi:hypothetical protein
MRTEAPWLRAVVRLSRSWCRVGDHAGIDPIGLGEVSAGAGELADRPGGQDTDAVAGGGQASVRPRS